jgi:hypothetical protein
MGVNLTSHEMKAFKIQKAYGVSLSWNSKIKRGDKKCLKINNLPRNKKSFLLYDADIVGAGFSGLYILSRLRETGYTVRVF